MMVKIAKSTYLGSVNAVPSKSYAHRLIISACLKKGQTLIRGVGDSDDVVATVRCMNALGADIQLINGDAKVNGIQKVNIDKTLDAGESGSTLRFMLPIVTALGGEATFTGKGKLLSRPNDALVKALNVNGGKVDGVKAFGKLNSGIYEIDVTVSSQYITGLLFALPLLEGDSKIIFKGNLVSRNYLDISKEILILSGIKFIEDKNGFTIYGNQEFKLSDEVVCEKDWSSAAFMLVAGALGERVTVIGLNNQSAQGDKVIIEVLRKAGANVRCYSDKIIVSGGQIKPFSVNLEDAPDLAPILSVLAVFANGESRFYGVERLKIKESDRIQAILDMLRSAGIQADYNNEYLRIIGGKTQSAFFNGYNDHRIVMSSVILAGLTNGHSIVSDSQAINKSYPNFYEHFKMIGGKINV